MQIRLRLSGMMTTHPKSDSLAHASKSHTSEALFERFKVNDRGAVIDEVIKGESCLCSSDELLQWDHIGSLWGSNDSPIPGQQSWFLCGRGGSSGGSGTFRGIWGLIGCLLLLKNVPFGFQEVQKTVKQATGSNLNLTLHHHANTEPVVEEDAKHIKATHPVLGRTESGNLLAESIYVGAIVMA